MTEFEVSSLLDSVWPGWEVVRTIGSGTYGQVFEIRKVDFGEVFSAALKVIQIPNGEDSLGAYRTSMSDADKAEYYQSISEKLMQEYSIMSKLKGNSNVVSYEDHTRIANKDNIGQTILIRMELLTCLTKYIDSCGLTRQQIIKLGIDICKALELCNKYKIIHRDIKPENIFISEFGEYKLGDFGVARTMEATWNMLSRQGTSMYMAPEVYANKPYGATADIYSLGLVMYQYANKNNPPFMSGKLTYTSQLDSLTKRMSGDSLPPPSEEQGPLADIILKACSFEPSDRYAEAADMRQALEALVDSSDNKSYFEALDQSSIPTSMPEIEIKFFDRDGKLLTGGKYFRNSIVQEPDIQKSILLNNKEYVFTGWSPQFTKTAVRNEDYRACYQQKDAPLPQNTQKAGEAPDGRGKTKFKPWQIASAAALLVVIVAVVLGVRGMGGRPETDIQAAGDGVNQEFGETDTAEPKEEPLWFDWSETLPDDISSDEYVVETKLQYRSCQATVYRQEQAGAGTLCYTADRTDDSEWSEWQDEEIEENQLLEVETGVFYRYREKHFRQVVMQGQVATKTSIYWGEWEESDKPKEASANTEVEEITKYRSRPVLTDYYYCEDADWGEFSDTPVYPAGSVVVNTRVLYRYAPREKIAPAEASMSNFPANTPADGVRYMDVSESKWYGNEKTGCIYSAVNLGALNTDEYMCFRPDENITMAELIKAAVVVSRVYNGIPGEITEHENGYQAYIDYAKENGLVSEVLLTDVEKYATRQEAAYILSNTLPESEFLGGNIVTSITDVSVDSLYYKSIYQFAQAGIISWPTPEYEFNPNKLMTRAEAAAIIDRLAYPENRIIYHVE